MLKLIVHHSPSLIGFLFSINLNLRLSRPQFGHVLRITDSLITSEAKHKTVASLYEIIVNAPDASNGCDSLRIAPWSAETIRESKRRFVIEEIWRYGESTGENIVYVSVDDSTGEKDKATRKLEAVEFHHDHTKSTKKKPVYTNGTVHVTVRIQIGVMEYAFDERLYLKESTVRRLNRKRPKEERLRFRKKGSLAQEMLRELKSLLPKGFKVYVLFDSWYASNKLIKFCRRNSWHVICAIKSNRKFDDKKLSQWNKAYKHRRYEPVSLTATDQRKLTYRVRSMKGRLNNLPFDVCVLISKRHHRDHRPRYFLCTDTSLSSRSILQKYQKRWPIEVDNLYVKQYLGLTDFRVQSFEATDKWFALVYLAYVFLQWRLNHSPPDQHLHSIAEVIRLHRQEHAKTLLQTACEQAIDLLDLPYVLNRFISQTV
ncbi:transposase [Moorena sp. SIO1G6]|uniref:transposase n=1 Tax=Moorena sp. SIO1G6 TaxID=2607840 RepID=UPI0033904225